MSRVVLRALATLTFTILGSLACSTNDPATGCSSDNDCKGARVCTDGQCVDRAAVGASGAGGGTGTAGAAAASGGGGAASGASGGGGTSATYFCASSGAQLDCKNVGLHATAMCASDGFCTSLAFGGCFDPGSLESVCIGATSPNTFAPLGCLAQATTCEGYAACKAQCGAYFGDACAQCLRPSCAVQLAACGKTSSCFSALGCVQSSAASTLNCKVEACTGTIAGDAAANDVLTCLSEKCGSACGATPSFPCVSDANTGQYLGSGCGACVDQTCSSLATACVGNSACASALLCVKSRLGGGQSMNCAVDGCAGLIAASPKSSDLLTCMASKCGTPCKATTGFECP